MLEIHVPEPLEGRPSTKFEIPIVKAKDVATIETSALPDDVYNEALYLGLKALANRGQSDVTGSTYPDEQERAEAATEIATKTIADMYLGKIRRSSGAKSTSAGKGELQVEARRLAKIYVKAELKEAGLRVSLIKPAEITKLANEMIANDPTILEEAKANIAKRHEKGKAKKIDVAALKAKVKEDPELVAKANKRGKSRKKVEEDEEAPPPTRVGRPGQRLNA
jgi:hypothetical protein